MTKIRKHSSKRISARKKYTCLKKVADHKRKLKKEMRKMKKAGIQKPLPKPLGIPNAFPGKAEMLDQYEDHERMQAQLKKDEKTYARAMKKIGVDGTMQNYPEILSSSKVIQQEKKTEGELTAQEIEEAERLMVQTGEIEAQPTKEFGISRRAYFKELERVLEDSDVILQVLDARDPESCRSEEIEAECLKRKKRLIQVINKVDLVPSTNAKQWQRYLSSEFPCLCFNAQYKPNLQHQNSSREQKQKQKELQGTNNIKQSEDPQELMRQELIKILHKNLRAMKDKEQLMVGVVGYPNTGKSSLVNLLRHSNATNVGTEPGTTKTTIIVDIDKKVSMLDCPGVIPKTEDDAGKAGLVLRHACKIDQSQVDPVPIVLELLEKVQMIDVLKLYHLGQYKTGQEMLQQLARKKGQLRQATVSIADAARTVLRDFSNGKFKYFTQVPKHGMEDDSD